MPLIPCDSRSAASRSDRADIYIVTQPKEKIAADRAEIRYSYTRESNRTHSLRRSVLHGSISHV
jgi:hypothetical protein